jgi:hypothetical protein
MAETAQIQLIPATQVAREVAVRQAANGVCYATYGDTRLDEKDLERIVQAVPAVVAAALTGKAYYFVPLTIGEVAMDDATETLVAPAHSNELSDRAICHRNVSFGGSECVFISSRLMQDRFALAFEFYINVGHAFVDTVGVPSTFTELAWSQAQADVRGETSQDAWENRRKALGREGTGRGESASNERSMPGRIDEKAKTAFTESAFADAVAVYLLSLTVDFDYADLREREYPLLAPAALADRLRLASQLFPPNAGYEFAIHYRRK